MICSKTLIMFFVLTLTLLAENPETTITKIKQNILLIKSASKLANINPIYLAAIIYTERTLNYDWEDDAMDVILADAGLNNSIGFCQVKLKTAYYIEKTLNKPFLPLSTSKNELIEKLSIDSLNILYAACYVKIISDKWGEAGFSLDDKPEIIGTLYSTGLYNRDGSLRVPNKNPKANKFGSVVGGAISIIKEFFSK
jgi:hypothetical protein